MVGSSEASDPSGSGAKWAHRNAPLGTPSPNRCFTAGEGPTTMGAQKGSGPHYKTVDPEVKRLQQENERLKKIIAKQALEIDFKDELLKKSH